jgi:hypothetical protein
MFVLPLILGLIACHTSGSTAQIVCSLAEYLLLTQSGHWTVAFGNVSQTYPVCSVRPETSISVHNLNAGLAIFPPPWSFRWRLARYECNHEKRVLLTLDGSGVPWIPKPSPADNPIQTSPTGLLGPGLIVNGFVARTPLNAYFGL